MNYAFQGLKLKKNTIRVHFSCPYLKKNVTIMLTLTFRVHLAGMTPSSFFWSVVDS